MHYLSLPLLKTTCISTKWIRLKQVENRVRRAVSKPGRCAPFHADRRVPQINIWQARKAAALTHTYLPEDPAAQDRLEKEAKDEERDIFRVCNEFLLQVHEVSC